MQRSSAAASWELDYKKALRVLPEAKAILGRALIVEAPLRADREQATDLIMLTSGPLALAFRVRDQDYLPKFRYDVTIREDRPSGAKCELEKILEGYASHYLYCFADYSDCRILGWRLLLLDAFRQQFRERRDTIKIKHNIANHDGSSTFAAVDVRTLAPECIVAQGFDSSVGADLPLPIICTEAIHFADGALEAGTCVMCVEPSENEVRGSRFVGGLIDDQLRDLRSSAWGVIEWKGTRRRVPLLSFAVENGESAHTAIGSRTSEPKRQQKVKPPPTQRELIEDMTGVDPDELTAPHDQWAIDTLYAKNCQLVPQPSGEWLLYGSLSPRQLLLLNRWLSSHSAKAIEWSDAQKAQQRWQDLEERRADVRWRLGGGS